VLSLPHAAILFAAAVLAGMMNSMAGGGTLVTFPTLLFLGTPAITANATSTVGLLPGALASFFGYRHEVAEHRAWLKTLLLPSLVGGAIGSFLLLATPEATFSRLVPFLILFATLLFSAQGLVRRWANRHDIAPLNSTPRTPSATGSSQLFVAILCQLGVAIYGGYFGAGIGILMLAVLGFMGLADIHAMNGLKTFFGAAINSVAAAYFIARSAVIWPLALLMIVGAIIGGYGGARLAKRIGGRRVRYVVIAIGLVASAVLAWREFAP
jgi:uncharacterized membrane protein YfcA